MMCAIRIPDRAVQVARSVSVCLVIPSRLLLASEGSGRDVRTAARFRRGPKSHVCRASLLKGKLRHYLAIDVFTLLQNYPPRTGLGPRAVACTSQADETASKVCFDGIAGENVHG